MGFETGAGKCPNVSHHPTKKGTVHLQQICEGDVKPIPKKGHLPTPVISCSFQIVSIYICRFP